MPETPSQETEEIELANFNKPDFVFIPPGRHTYRQEGCYLVCRNCELHHAVHIGMNKLMVGENEDGTPILIDRDKYEEYIKTK